MMELYDISKRVFMSEKAIFKNGRRVVGDVKNA